MKTLIKQFLIVDDDPQNNSLSRMAIRKVLGNVPVKDFEVPETGLEYIGKDFETGSSDEKTVLLLDINMPTMTGWEFLEEFDKLSENIKMQFQIYMLSSSVDPSDIDFIEKPLNKEDLEKMFGVK